MKSEREVQAQIDDLLQEAEDYSLEGEKDLAAALWAITRYLKWVIS